MGIPIYDPDPESEVIASVLIQELGVRTSVGPFELSVGRRATRTLYLMLPEDVEPGTYYARVTVKSDSLQRTVHRPIDIE